LGNPLCFVPNPLRVVSSPLQVFAADFWDEFVHRLEPAEIDLGGCARLAPVAVDHVTRFVAGAVADPRFRATRGQGEGDEGASQIVHTEGEAGLGALEKLPTSDARIIEIFAEDSG
jgi:hypothetical protein